MSNKKKLGIAAVNYKENVGSALQTFATHYTLEKMGYDTRFFEIKGVYRQVHIKKHLYYAGRMFDPVELKYLLANLKNQSRKSTSASTDHYAQDMIVRKQVYASFYKKWNKMLPFVKGWSVLTKASFCDKSNF